MLTNVSANCTAFLRWALLSFSLCAFAKAQDDLTAAKFSDHAPPSAGPANTLANPDPSWHADFTLYLWFPGAHGTLGANDRNVDFRRAPVDAGHNAAGPLWVSARTRNLQL
jgi:hypothetical protein